MKYRDGNGYSGVWEAVRIRMSCDKHMGSGERSGVMRAVLGNYVQQQQSADGTANGQG